MSDLVNDTAKRQLSPKNSEPSHLKGGSYDVLGGPAWDNKGSQDDYKFDAAKGVGTDTSIPKATGPESTHLPPKQEEVDVKFDGDKDEKDLEEADDLDKELDKFEEVEPVEVDIEVDDEDEKKSVEEEVAGNDETEERPYPGLKKSDSEKLAEEEEEIPTAKKDETTSEEAVPELDSSEVKKAANDADLPLKEEDEEEEEKLDEAVKVRIKLPNAKLFESAGLAPKTQRKVAVVFEQVVRDTTKQVAAQVHAHYKKLHEQRLRERDTVMAKQMDNYLSYVVEEWMKANRPVIRKSLRTQLAEEFLSGLQRLFKEHYIDVPDSKVDVVAKLTEQNAKLKASLNEQHAQKLKLRRLAESANKARIVAEFARGMSEVSAAKLHKLAEDTQYTTAKDFREKLTMLKESYFPKGGPKVTKLPEEEVQDVTPKSSPAKGIDPDVNAIAEVLASQAKTAKW